MPINTIFLALAAGLISAVVFASATTGPAVLRLVLFFLTPLSLYLAGLGLGPAACAIAALSATLIILLLTNPLTAFVYAVSTGGPAYVTTRLALLSRSLADDGDAREWYPLGRIVASAAIFGGVLAGLILVLMGGDVEALTKAMRGIVDAFVKGELAQLPGAPDFKEPQLAEITATAVRTLPWALGILSMGTILLNLWLAGRVTLASGRLTRPWPDLTQLALPSGAIFAVLAATAATFAGGLPGLMAAGFAGAFTLAFALIGLCVAHVLSRGSPWRNFTLAALYSALLVFIGPVSLVLAIVGIAETVFGYRAASERGPPPNSS
jgi:hypothetical protein